MKSVHLLCSSFYVHLFSALYSLFGIPRGCMLFMYPPAISGFLLPRGGSACVMPHLRGYDMYVPPYPYPGLSIYYSTYDTVES